MGVDHSLSYVPQSTDDTCWAASTAMMMGRGDDMQIVREMQTQFPDSVWDNGATELELGQVARHYGLNQVYPVCQGADGWESWLDSNGPMLVQVPGNAFHSIVVVGIRGGDTGDSCEPLEMHVLDPWNGDRWLEFDRFNNDYELAGDWTNNVYSR